MSIWKNATVLIFALLVLSLNGANLQTKSGAIYENYEIDKVTPQGLSVLHDRGSLIVPYNELPDEIRRQYADQEKKYEQRQAENEAKQQNEALLNSIIYELRSLKIQSVKNGFVIGGIFNEPSTSVRYIQHAPVTTGPQRAVSANSPQPPIRSRSLSTPYVVSDDGGWQNIFVVVDIDTSKYADGDRIGPNYERVTPINHSYSIKSETKYGHVLSKNKGAAAQGVTKRVAIETNYRAECSRCKNTTARSATKPDIKLLNKGWCTPEKENVLRLYQIGNINIDGRTLKKYTINQEKALEYLKNQTDVKK